MRKLSIIKIGVMILMALFVGFIVLGFVFDSQVFTMLGFMVFAFASGLLMYYVIETQI